VRKARSTSGVAVAPQAGFHHDYSRRGQPHAPKKAIKNGTTRMRTHVEVGSAVGLTSVHALAASQEGLCLGDRPQLCFSPGGLLDDPGCERLMVAALEAGAEWSAARLTWTGSHGQIARIFALAQRFDIDIDFHPRFRAGYIDLMHWRSACLPIETAGAGA